MKSTFKTKDNSESLRIIKNLDLAACLHEISYTVRRKHTKYSKYNEEQQKVADDIFEEIGEYLSEYNINLKELLP